MASTVINALAPHVRDTVRMGFRWAAPRATAVGVKFVSASHAAREFVRDLAEQNFEALTESEYREITAGSSGNERVTGLGSNAEADADADAGNLIDLEDGERLATIVRSTGDGDKDGGREEEIACVEKPRCITLHCRNIRASRNLGPLEALGAPIPQLSHWCIEVDGVFCELRAINGAMKTDDRVILHSEVGERDRGIKLEITTNRTMMRCEVKKYEVGTTVLSTEHVIKIASVIFRRFAQSYDLFIDNCQLFCQLLVETISGQENADQVRRILNEKSVLSIPIAASWIAGPAYHFMAVVHHALPSAQHTCPPDGEFCFDCPLRRVQQRVDAWLKTWENFHYHPRVYDSREKTKKKLDAAFDRMNPFS